METFANFPVKVLMTVEEDAAPPSITVVLVVIVSIVALVIAILVSVYLCTTRKRCLASKVLPQNSADQWSVSGSSHGSVPNGSVTATSSQEAHRLHVPRLPPITPKETIKNGAIRIGDGEVLTPLEATKTSKFIISLPALPKPEKEDVTS